MIEPFRYSQHAEMVSKWGDKYKFPLPPYQFLPNRGYVVDDTACGFLYNTDSRLGWIEWVFANPEKTAEERKRCLDILFKTLIETAKELGMEAIFSAASHEGYREVLKRCEFSESDRNVTHF